MKNGIRRQPDVQHCTRIDSTSSLGRLSVVHCDPALNVSTATTIDQVRVGQFVTATVVLDSIRQTTGGRASGVVTALAGGRALVSFDADANRRLARILNAGTRLIVRGPVVKVGAHRVLDVRNAVVVTV